jgi:hypothetical protein
MAKVSSKLDAIAYVFAPLLLEGREEQRLEAAADGREQGRHRVAQDGPIVGEQAHANARFQRIHERQHGWIWLEGEGPHTEKLSITRLQPQDGSYPLVHLMGGVSAPIAVAVEAGIPNSSMHLKLRKAAVGGQDPQTALWMEAAHDAPKIKEYGGDSRRHG